MGLKDQELSEEIRFQTGQEVRVLICGGREMIFPESCISAVMELNDNQSAKYLQQGSVRLKDFGSFWSDLSQEFTGSLATYNNRALKKITLPLMVPRGIGLPGLPDEKARFLVVLSLGNWHGVVLSYYVNEQPILLGNFNSENNGDVVGQIERRNLGAILLIDVVSLLKREGYLTVTN